MSLIQLVASLVSVLIKNLNTCLLEQNESKLSQFSHADQKKKMKLCSFDLKFK